MVAIEPQSKGDLDKMGPALPADARGGADRPAGAQRDRRAGPADDGRGPHRGHHRAPQAQVRRGDRDPHAQGPVQGDDPRQDPGPRPLQEADRRARHVRRRLAGARAEPRRRRRVRRAGRRRVGARRASSPASRRASARRPRAASRRLSPVRLQGDALRRVVPPGRLERAVVQDRGVDGAQGRRPPRQAGAARADHGGRDPDPRGLHGRGQPRPQRPAWPGPRAWTADGEVQVIIAHVPQAELFTYATELRSLAQGRGSFSATLDHYEDVPWHIAEKVIEAHRKSSRRPAATAAVTERLAGPNGSIVGG